MDAAAWLLAGLVLSAPGKDDLLPNGGFEDDLKGWRLLDNSGGSDVAIDKKTRKEGKKALHWTRQGAGTFDVLRTDLGDLPDGGRLRVSAWVKRQDVTNFILKVFFYGQGGTDLGQGSEVATRNGTADWEQVVIDNAMPEGHRTATLFLLMTGPGEVWIDGVEATTSGGTAPSARAAAPEALDRATKAWLDKNAIALRALDFDGSQADLAPLKKVLKDVRVVQLGEQSHGDGETFRAKARLVRFLHEQMGFDVLAFESGLFECEQANELLRQGDVRAAMSASVFGIWRVQQTEPLFRYLADRANEPRPLRLAGFDVRASGRMAREFLPGLLEFTEGFIDVTEDDRAALRAIDDLLDEDSYEPEDRVRQSAQAALHRLREGFDQSHTQLVTKHGERAVSLWSWCLYNYVARESFEHSKKEDLGKHGSVNLRDERMAQNLRWLLETWYPDAKVVCWAATFHQARNLEKVSIDGDPQTYRGCRAMGEFVHEWYGDKVYTVAFAAHHGKGGIGGDRFTLAEPQGGSIEDVLHRYGKPYLFVDLRRDGPFAKAMHCSPMSYSRDIVAPWPEVVDAILFTDEMTGSRWLE